MNDRPYALILGLLGALALAMAAAWYFGGAQQGPIAGSAATETFRAKAGTQRENARALISSREHVDGKEGTRADPVEVWGRFDDSEADGVRRDSPEESLRLAEEVLADLSTEDAMSVLRAEAELTESPSALYTAMGVLYARDNPYDTTQVEDAFALALSTASTPDERSYVVFQHARVLLERGLNDDLVALLDRTRPENLELSTRTAQIEILRANALWNSGNTHGAESVLQRLVDRTEVDSLVEDAEFQSVYRQASMRLVRMYKESGNQAAADEVRRAMKSRLRF